jgi:uncharacterized membrane protein
VSWQRDDFNLEMAMATVASSSRAPYTKPINADLYERMLSVESVILLAFVLTALFKGRADWARVPPEIWPHIATILIAVTLTPVMLLRRRGDRLHRQLGWVWVAAMFSTALLSMFVRNVNNGGFSFIHILSVWTMIQVPIIAWSARQHNVKRHRYGVRAMVTGALLIAGFFTFPFNRLLGQWLFG